MNVVSPMILDSSGNVLRRIDPVDVSLDLQLEPLSSAEIELKPGDTIPERSWVSVYTEHGLAGIFRSRPQRDRYGERSSRVSLVHGAVELNDYLTTKGGDQEQDPASTAIAYIMQFYLGTHWRLGTVSATSSVVYQLNGSGVLDAITEIMDQLPGYMLVFDQSVTPWTLNVLPRPETVSAEGRLSRNISSVEISRDDSSLCTRVYYGENDLFVEDAAAIQKYGVIEYRISDSGLTNAQLAAIAQAYLDNHKASKLSVSISAIDFYNATGEPLDRITLGSKYRLAIPDAETEENRVIEAIICSIHYDSVRSKNPQITLASDPDTIITFLKKQRRSGGSARQIAKEEAQKQYEHFVEETDAYRKEIYRVNGVVYDSNGNIVYQTDPVTGEYILDNAGNKIPVYNPESNGSISGQIIQSAQRMATIIKQSGTVTEVFDKTKAYVIGDCVLYPDANGNPYRFTKDHDANTDWKGTGENGDVEALGTLQSQIDQNVDYTASIYGTVTDLGGDVRQIKGSTIWQNETAIANIIGTVEIDKDGNLKIKDGKGLYVTGDSTINGFIKDNQMTAGYLIKKINGDETEAAVKADKIYLDADKTVKVGEALFITTGGAFWVKRNATFGNKAGEFVTINGGTVNAPTLQVNSGGSLQFSPGSQSGSPVTINHATAASLITDVHIKGPSENDNYYTLEYQKIGTGAGTWNPTTVKIPVSATSGLTDATVANNILTLTKSDGSTVNFSKATSVTGEWGSRATPESSPVPNGTLYVKATQTNRNTTTGQDETTTVGSMDIHLHNAGHWGSASTTGEDVNTYYYRVTASQGNSASMSETGLSFNIDAGGRYTAGQDSITYSFTKAISLPTGINPTNFEPSALWRYHVTKDGTDVVDAYYKVPAAIVPKVSASGWANGANTFTAGTSGESSIPVSLSIDAALNKTSGTASLRVLDGTTATGATKSLYLHVENAYVYILNQANAQPNDNTTTGNIVARITNTGYTNGWKAAHDAIVWPNPTTPSASMTITTPKSAPSPTPNTEGTTYTLSVDENYAYLKTGSGSSEKTVAQIPNAYGAVDPKVSKSAWQNGSTTFTAGTSGEASIPVSLSVVPSTNWSNASVPANPTFRIDDGQSPTGLTGTFRLQVNNDYVYVKSDTNNPVVGTNVLARQTNTAYAAGKQAVTVKSVVRVENCDYDDDQGTAYDDVTVTLWDGTTVTKTLTIQDVDFSDAYQAGLNGQQAPAYLDFEIPMEDENGTVIDTYDWRCTNLSDIYQRGVDDATPATPKYYITTSGDPIIMWKSSGGDYSNFCGWLYPRTEVTVLGTSGYFYQVSYDGVTGYIAQARVEYSTSPTSSTNYPGKTGWSTFAENGYTYYAKTNTANVNLREGPSTSYPIILKMPADAQLYCMYDPADLPPDNQWNDVVYKKATHNLYLGSVDCSYINMEDATITVTVNWLRHSSGDYGSSIPTFMLPNGAETNITSTSVSDTSYVNTPVSSGVNINDFFNPTKTGFFGRYELAAVALTEMWHKVNFTVSYSDGSPSQTYTCEFKSYKKTSSAEFDVGQTVYVYASNGGSVIVRTVPSVPSGTYGNLTPHTPVTIVSGPDNGYYQIRYAQTGYNTVTGYINADYLRSSVQGSSNYNYTGWVKSEPVEPTVTSRTISIVEVVHNRSVTTTTPISTRFTLKSPYTTSSSGGSLLVANSSARPSDAYNNHGSGYTRLSSLTAYFSQVTHSSSVYNYTLEHSVIFTVTTNYSDNTSTSTTYVGKISSNKS